MKNWFRFSGKILFFGTLLASVMLTSCNGDDDNNGVVKVDPNTIATTNLVAHFPFDGTATERIANLTPVVQPGLTFVPGRRNQAFQGANNAHLRYNLPTGSPLRALTSFSIAMWMRSPLVTGAPVPTIFEIGNSQDFFWGNLKIHLDRLPDTADSLNVRVFFMKDGVPWSGQHIGFGSRLFTVDRWMHLVLQYDAVTSKFTIFHNGTRVTTNPGVEDRWAEGTDVTPRRPLGPLNFVNADVINIGSWRPVTQGTSTDEWMGWFRGNLDELRVYSRALTATEVKGLYDAEVSQITN